MKYQKSEAKAKSNRKKPI